MANHSAMKVFEDYVLSGGFSKDASEAVAEAIGKSRALGLPVEGYLNSDPAQESAAPMASEKNTLMTQASFSRRHIAA